jgi:MerR family transcriptional regulator, light-induced transcriptional regulator
MSHYSIKDLEQLSGIKAHTIRMWEKRYSIIEPKRTPTNIRYYSDQDLKKILNISILNKSGIRVSEIARLNTEQIRDKIVHLTNNPKNIKGHIEGLVVAMIDMDEGRFEKLLSRLILQNGFRKTVMQVIFPFLEKIGVLWQTGSINPAQEHFVTNIIRRKFIVAIDSQTLPDAPIEKIFLLFLHEKELHELTLLFFNYVLRRKGFKVIYLGAQVPLDDVVQVAKIKKADYLFTSFITHLSEKEFSGYINKLTNEFSDKLIFITGNQVINHGEKFPDNIRIISSSADVEEITDIEQLV